MESRYKSHSEFINQQQQEKLAKTRVLIAGCGAGSPVAPHLARLGIGRESWITLADPDTVSLQNLTRQSYFENNINDYKVEALAKHIKTIDSAYTIKTVREGITEDNVDTLVQESDIVIEMIDISAPKFVLSLHNAAERCKKPVVTGLDIGERAINYVFDYRDPKSMTYYNFLGLPFDFPLSKAELLNPLALVAQLTLGPVKGRFGNTDDVIQYYAQWFEDTQLLQNLYMNLTPEFIIIAQKLLTGQLDYVPQINTASATLGVIQSAVTKKLALGEKVKVAPDRVDINIAEMAGI